jgi:hypothetical protein
MRNRRFLRDNLDELLARGYRVETPWNMNWVCVHGVALPGTTTGKWTDHEGQAIIATSLLIDIPYDFPLSPPGIGCSHPTRAIHLPRIYYNGTKMKDLYDCVHEPWAWLCFQSMRWDPEQDNLLSLVALVEASVSGRLREAGLW